MTGAVDISTPPRVIYLKWVLKQAFLGPHWVPFRYIGQKTTSLSFQRHYDVTFPPCLYNLDLLGASITVWDIDFFFGNYWLCLLCVNLNDMTRMWHHNDIRMRGLYLADVFNTFWWRAIGVIVETWWRGPSVALKVLALWLTFSTPPHVSFAPPLRL